jgi:hypothetical protein
MHRILEKFVLFCFVCAIIFVACLIMFKNNNEKYVTKRKFDGLAHSGGGTSSLTVQFSIMNTLFRRVRKRKNLPNMTIPDLYRNIEVISANSGGSWFNTLLCYDREFYTDFHLPTETPEDTKLLFFRNYVSQLEYKLDQFNSLKIYDIFPNVISNFLSSITENSIMYATEPWSYINNNIWLLGKTCFIGLNMEDCLEEFQDKDIVYQSGILTNSIISGGNWKDIESKDNALFTYSFKHPLETCLGPQLCRKGLRNTWDLPLEKCCVDCCRNNNISQTCPFSLCFYFSKSGFKPIGDFNTLQVQYFGYKKSWEIEPLFPNKIEEQSLANITQEDFSNFRSNSQSILFANSASSAATSFLQCPCNLKLAFISFSLPNELKNFIITKLLSLSAILSPYLVLNNTFNSNKLFSTCQDISNTIQGINCGSIEVKENNDTSLIQNNQNIANNKILKFTDGVFLDDTGIVAQIRGQQERSAQNITILAITRLKLDDLKPFSDNIDRLFLSNENVANVFKLKLLVPNFILRRSETSLDGSYLVYDNSIPPKSSITDNFLTQQRPNIFEPYKKVKIYPSQGYIEANENNVNVKMNYLYFNCLKTRDVPTLGIRAGTKVNLHVIQVFNNLALVPFVKWTDTQNMLTGAKLISDCFERLSDELKEKNIVILEDLF